MIIGSQSIGPSQANGEANRRRSQNSTRFVGITWRLSLAALMVAAMAGCSRAKPQAGKIIGGSMSPNFLGEHYHVVCGACRFSFACDIEQADERQQLVCSNCGDQIEFSNGKTILADSVEIRSPKSPIERWDVVAFRMPADANRDNKKSAGIKRIAGLPGEAIEIRGGNLLVNGAIIHKNINQQKAVRIQVHDTYCPPKHNRQWQLFDNSGWQLGKSFEFTPITDNTNVQWFAYRNQRNYSHPTDELQTEASFPIEDYYAFNQSLSRNLNPMDEVFVSMDVTISLGSTLAWRFDHRGTVYEFQIDVPRSELRVTSPGKTINTTTLTLGNDRFTEPNLFVEFSSFDRQLVVWVNGKKVFHRELVDSSEPVSRRLLMFGAANSRLVFRRIRIWRDLYYFNVAGKQGPGLTKVSQDGYFVLGDNVPLSVDSRHWQSPSLKRSDIIGVVQID